MKALRKHGSHGRRSTIEQAEHALEHAAGRDDRLQVDRVGEQELPVVREHNVGGYRRL